MNQKVLSINRYQDDINTKHNMKPICRAAVAQWIKTPDLQWIYAGSKLERRKYSIITNVQNCSNWANMKPRLVYVGANWGCHF